jgi:hypothetical protein
MQAQQQPQTEHPEWQSRLRERLLTGKGHGADSLLSEIPAEDALTAIRDILLPEAQRQGKALAVRNVLGFLMLWPVLALMFAWRLQGDLPIDLTSPKVLALLVGPLLLLMVLWLVYHLKSHRLALLWGKIYLLLPELLGRVQTGAALSALIDFVGWFQTFGDTAPVHAGTPSGYGTLGAIEAASRVADAHTNLRRTARHKMTQLLGRLSAEEARALTENNRLVLLKLAQKAEDEVDMGIAALLALGTMGEARVRPVAQKLTASFLPRVREAAKECLQSI